MRDPTSLRKPRPVVSDRAFGVYLTVTLFVSLAVRLVAIDADAPADVGRDLALSTDGSWYTAAALDRTIGRDCDAPSDYDRPLFTAWARVVYAVCGPTLAATNGTSVPPAIAAVLFTALAARALRGNLAGLVAALLLASNHAFFVFSRSAIIYPFLTMVAAIVVWLVAYAERSGRSAPVAVATAITATAVVALKPILILLAPLLLIAKPLPAWLRCRPLCTTTIAASGALVLLVAAITTGLTDSVTQKVRDYSGSVTVAEILGNVLALETRAELFRSLPIVAPLALLAGARRRLLRAETALVITIALALLAFAPFRYTPLRYLLVLFPAFAVLAASVLVAALERARAPAPQSADPQATRALDEGLRPSSWSRVVRTPWALWLAWLAATAVAPEFAPGTAVVAVLATTLALAVVWAPSRSRHDRLRAPRSGRRAFAGRLGAAHWVAIALAAAVIIEATRSASALAAPRYTTRAALAEIDTIVAPDAILSGLYSHLLTTESTVDRKLVSASRFGGGRLRRTYESRGVTHLTLDGGPHVGEILARFAHDDAALELVHTFHVRGVPVLLLRFEYASDSYTMTDYERGVRAAARGALDGAIADFRKSAASFERSASPRSALAAALLARGDLAGAADAAVSALALDSADVRALGVEVDVLLRAGRPHDARERLARIVELAPRDEHAARTLGRLDAELARHE